MILGENFRLAFEAPRANPTRSILTYAYRNPPGHFARVTEEASYWIWVEYVDHHGEENTKRFVGRPSDRVEPTVEVEYRRTDPESSRWTRTRAEGLSHSFFGLGLTWAILGTILWGKGDGPDCVAAAAVGPHP